MTARQLLARLEGVKVCGDGWRALCPSHSDVNPSLSIHEREGKTLLYCHGGCTTENVLAALDVTLAELASTNGNHNGNSAGRRIVATYPYVDETGKHLYDVVRFDPKDFRQRSADGSWSMRGVRRVLYRLPEVITADTVYVVEGERDADALAGLGLTATCNPGGAGKWGDEYTASLREKKVVIVPDNDGPGRDHAKSVASELLGTAAIVRVLHLDRLPEKGDASDWIDRRRTDGLDDAAIANELTKLAESAPESNSNDEDGRPRAITVRLSDVEPEEITWLWDRRLARGKLSLVIGDPGLGKSTITLDAACRVSTGSPWPDGGIPSKGNTILLSAEDGVADTIRRRVDILGGDPSRIHVLTAVRTGDDERPFSLATDLPVLGRVFDEIGDVRVVVVDPLSAYLGSVDSYKDAEIRRVLSPLSSFAERHGITVIGIVHVTKSSERKAIHRALGSVAFVAAARTVFAVGRDPDDDTRRILACVKNNLSAEPEALAFRIVEDGSLVWEGAVVIDADSVLSSGSTCEERSEREEAAEFLRDMLGDGELPSKEIQAAARDNGIAEKTLRRAKADLDVRVRKDGQPGQRQRWMWSLPKSVTDVPKVAMQGNVATFGQENETKLVSSTTSPKMATSSSMATFGAPEAAPDREEVEL